MTMPAPGEIYQITSAASVQFAAGRGFRFRVIRTHVSYSTPTGWVWIDGYQLDDHGLAESRREIFVQTAGLINVTPPPAPRHRPTNAGPARIPQQRTSSRPRTTIGGLQ